MTPLHHAPVIALTFAPHLAARANTFIDGAMDAAGTSAQAVGLDKLACNGVLYHGLEVLAGGALPGGPRAGRHRRVRDRPRVTEASAFALAGGVLSYLGFIHGDASGIGGEPGVAPSVTLPDLLTLAYLIDCARDEFGVEEPEFDEPFLHGGLLAQPAE